MLLVIDGLEGSEQLSFLTAVFVLVAVLERFQALPQAQSILKQLLSYLFVLTPALFTALLIGQPKHLMFFIITASGA